jgi:hypothetical protein
MIRPGIVWGVAKAEARLSRRLVRYWLFQSLAGVVGLVIFLYYYWLHYAFSSWSGTAAMLNPRFLISAVGIYYLVAFLLGLVFLGYDVRARDSRERMAEVLDAVPCSNLELLGGRFLGILLPAWIPVLIVAIGLSVLSAIMGQPFEWHTVVAFVFLMAIPAYCLVLGLTFLLTLLLRHRLLAAVAVIGILIGLVVVNFGFIPLYLLPIVDITGGFSIPWATDIIPQIVDGYGLLQRTGTLLAGLALLLFAAALHPRKDDSNRSVTAAAGAALLVAAALLCGLGVWDNMSVMAQEQSWEEFHAARSEEPAPDLLALGGEVRLWPGRDLSMELDLRFRAPQENTLEKALFTLNPGLEVRALHSSGGEELPFVHENGLLEIDLPAPLAPGDEAAISMEIGGRPDLWFAYLDAAFSPLGMSIRDGQVMMLGFYNYLNDRRYVALMPGVRWLPASGAEIGRGDPKVRPTDFFDLDLTVELPEGWLAAGPGRRQEVAGGAEGNRVRFRFAPPAPLPEVPLLASRFESRSEEIDGLTLEVLIYPGHAENVDFFADAATEIRNWATERLQEADDLGLGYPYDALTLVEVPGSLRGYGGGWRMDSTMIQPAMVLARESGFPTANFAARFKNTEQYQEQEGGVPRAKRNVLERFFENDFTGGNPFVAASRSFFGFQTGAEGDEGLPLDFVCENLSTQLVTEKTGYFSVHMMGEDMNQAIQRSLGAIFSNQGGDGMADAIIHAVTSRNDVWDEALGVSLSEMNPWEEPEKAVDVLTLKGGAMARSMLDDLGREKTGNLLAELRTDTWGRSYGHEAVLAAGEKVGEDLGPWLDVWLHRTELPGFVLGEVQFFRITDDDDGSANYQVLVTVYNGEETPGLLRLDYRSRGERGRREGGESDPVRVEGKSAVQIGLVTSEPPRVVRVVPYLALNRDPFNAPLPALDEEKIVEAEPFIGARDSDWVPSSEGMIVVDDLDEGFTVEETGGRSMLRVAGRGGDEEMDQGLPLVRFGPRQANRWSRWNFGNAYGRYRHTAAVVRKGSGDRRAIFTAEIPRSGQWELEYFVPQMRGPGPGGGGGRRGSGPGTWNLAVADSAETRDLTFDVAGSETGWNSLGSFDITEGEVRVVVSDETDGPWVLADAVRWIAVEP